MARKKKKSILSTIISLVVIAAIAWMKYNETNADNKREGSVRDESVVISQPASGRDESMLTPVSLSSSKFDILENCTLIDDRGNDGDSFHVKTPQGDKEFRLYYVDAPESAAREYRDGNTNYKRIAEQGAALGGLSQKQTTEVGVEAKAFVKKLLKGNKFRVATVWENVYGPERKYAYILVSYEGKERYLHELLTVRGLSRIHTKPYILPDNTSTSRQRDQLRKLESYAKKNGYGAWGM